jgi:aldehyde dehydrogenase (NAD+)
MTLKLGHLINGERVGADSAGLESLNPSNTDEVVAYFPAGDGAAVDAAVAAARAAQPGWANASPEIGRASCRERV